MHGKRKKTEVYMSYYTIHRIPGTTVQFPASTAILQDMVVSSRDLDQMERTLETNPARPGNSRDPE